MKYLFLALRASAVALATIAVMSCSYHTQSASTTAHYRVTDPIAPLRAERVGLTTDVVGCFVAVSNYEAEAGVFSTPAHALGAALMNGLFTTAAAQNKDGFFEAELVADLLLRPDSEEAGAVEILRSIGGVDVTPYKKGTTPLDSEGRWPALGLGFPVTRQRIVNAISETIAKFREHPGSALVIYIAAHGKMSADGRPYLLAADSKANDPATWLFYDDLLVPIYGAAREMNTDVIRSTVLIVIDACQIGGSPAADRLTALDPPEGVTLILSTSPGQYAWHWTATRTVVGEVKVTSDQRFGFPFPPPRAEGGPIHRVQQTTMSLFPIAARRALRVAQDQFDAIPLADRLQVQVVAYPDWLKWTNAVMQSYLADLAAENPDTAIAQTISIRRRESDDEDLRWVMFQLVPKDDDLPKEDETPKDNE
jgi:hypothetical protein